MIHISIAILTKAWASLSSDLQKKTSHMRRTILEKVRLSKSTVQDLPSKLIIQLVKKLPSVQPVSSLQCLQKHITEIYLELLQYGPRLPPIRLRLTSLWSSHLRLGLIGNSGCISHLTQACYMLCLSHSPSDHLA
jgi:hypothetical protein